MSGDSGFDQLAAKVSEFLIRHRSAFYEISSQLSNVFESWCYVLFVSYYETAGYELRPENLLDGNFRFKYNTKGYAWNYSYFIPFSTEVPSPPHGLFEIRHNQQVAGAWVEISNRGEDEPPMFALDIAVIKPDSLPDFKRGQPLGGQQYWVNNADLITFGEAKKLVAYPMLLAQFLGIVHEIKPEFIKAKDGELEPTLKQKHPYPVLFTSNNLMRGTERVLKSFMERELLITIIDNVMTETEDCLLSKFGTGASREPLPASVIS
jgi:hypothetical protein